MRRQWKVRQRFFSHPFYTPETFRKKQVNQKNNNRHLLIWNQRAIFCVKIGHILLLLLTMTIGTVTLGTGSGVKSLEFFFTIFYKNFHSTRVYFLCWITIKVPNDLLDIKNTSKNWNCLSGHSYFISPGPVSWWYISIEVPLLEINASLGKMQNYPHATPTNQEEKRMLCNICLLI